MQQRQQQWQRPDKSLQLVSSPMPPPPRNAVGDVPSDQCSDDPTKQSNNSDNRGSDASALVSGAMNDSKLVGHKGGDGISDGHNRDGLGEVGESILEQLCLDLALDHDHVNNRAAQEIDAVSALIGELEKEEMGERVSSSQAAPMVALSFESLRQLLEETHKLAKITLANISETQQKTVAPRSQKRSANGISSSSTVNADTGAGAKKRRRLRRNKKGVIPVPCLAKQKVANARERVNGRFVEKR